MKNTVRVAIRDDDTNFFTDPEEIMWCYEKIWGVVPVTLCLISKVKGNWKKWVHQIYKTRQKTDWNAWRCDDKVFPIEENRCLLSFLQENQTKKTIDIAFHAIHHRNEDPIPPNELSNNYIQGAEFYTNLDLTNKLNRELSFLESLFNRKITVFTPPQNLLSEKGYRAVVACGLNICGGGIPFYRKEKTLRGILALFKQGLFKLVKPGFDYPWVIRYSRHSEIIYHYPLQPGTRIEFLKNAFQHVWRFNGDFVLSTHYIEFDYKLEYNNSKTMRDIFYEFLDFVKTFKNVKFVTLSEMLQK